TADVDLEPFGRGKDFEVAADAVAGQRLHPVEGRVVVPGIVMEEREPARAGGAGHVGRVLDGRMAPALLRRVFLFGVLRVVDDEIDVAHELDVPLVAGMLVPAGRRVPERLVIRGVGAGGTDARDAV